MMTMQRQLCYWQCRDGFSEDFASFLASLTVWSAGNAGMIIFAFVLAALTVWSAAMDLPGQLSSIFNSRIVTFSVAGS